MVKNFPKEIVDIIIIHFLKKGNSFRDIQQNFVEVKDYNFPSLGYISKVHKKLNKKPRAPGQAP